MARKTTRCEHCGSTRTEFDPPLIIESSELSEACGAVKPGNYSTSHPGGIPHCMLPAHGPEEEHAYLVEEYVVRWADDNRRNGWVVANGW